MTEKREDMTMEERVAKAKGMFAEKCEEMIEVLTSVKEKALKLEDKTFTEDTLYIVASLTAVSERSSELASIYGASAAKAALDIIKEATNMPDSPTQKREV